SSEKKEASFSMLRIAKPKVYRQRFSLSKKEIANLEFAISQKSAAFLLGNTEKIIVRLTDTGKQWYQRRLNNRPESYVYDSTTDEYLFSCP
ncbi:MAG: hypothetical protein J6Z35_06030, partial [Lachnospiraceae bacterium]|nr:hypothetical protein [Lachnospiraceae bacterium]